jgi:hypothetical protein
MTMTLYDVLQDKKREKKRLELLKASGGLASEKTLRDEFAGQALMGFCSDYTGRSEHADSIIYLVVPHVYRIADAMLKARKTTGEGE